MAEDLDELGELLKKLFSLYSLATPYNRQNVEKAKGITQRLKDVTSNMSEVNMGSLFSLVFDSQKGLPQILKAAVRNESANDVVIVDICEIFTRMFSVYAKHSERLAPYLVEIKEPVYRVMLTSSSAKTRQTAALVLLDLLRCAASVVNEKWESVLELQELYQRVVVNLTQPVKSSKVAHCDMQIIAVLARSFPDVVKSDASRLFREFLHKMEKQMASPKTDYGIVAGCIEALGGIMNSFPESFDETKKARLYEYLCKIISEGLLFDRRSAPRAALHLIAEQINIFIDMIIPKCPEWYRILLQWSEHSNPEDYKPGLKCFVSFLQQTAKFLGSRDIDQKTDIISFLVRNLYDLLKKETMKKKITGVAVESLAELSQALNANDVSTLFQFVLKKTEMTVVNQTEGDLKLLHVFLQALGIVCVRLAEPLTAEQSYQVERSVVFLIGSLPSLGETVAYNSVRAVAILLLGMYVSRKSEQAYRAFVMETVFQALIRSCVQPVGVEDRPELPRSLVSFWKQLMQFPSRKDITVHFSVSIVTVVQQVLDEAFMTNVSAIVQRLDFTTNDARSTDDTDEKEDEEIVRSPDCEIFANLVEISDDILAAVEPFERLQKWVPALAEQILLQSQRFPNSPDLYRMAAVLLRSTREKPDFSDKDSLMEYIRFVAEYLSRMSDEPLTYALQVLLNCPAWLLVPVIDHIILAVASALKMGLSDLFLAELTLTALERWQQEVDPANLRSLFQEVLPFVEPYLRNADDARKQVPLFRRKTSRVRKYAQSSGVDPWIGVQRRAILLVGSLDQAVTRRLAQPHEDVIEREALAWRSLGQGHLSFAVSFGDMKPSLVLENFLPRIVHLTLYSGDREAKLAACEYLHATLIYLVGSGAQSTEEYRRSHSFEKLYERLLPVVLQLAVDVDSVARQVFQTLLIQVVHWFARPAFIEPGHGGRATTLSAETNVLLETLVDAACSPEESSPVRGAATLALREFLHWNIRQSTDSILWDTPTVPKVLFKKLHALASHKSVHKRLGASLIFNRIYRVFRESKPLLSIFTLEFVGHFIYSLALADTDPESAGTVGQCRKTLQHLQRMVLEKSSVFETPHPKRRLAPFYVNGTLDELELHILANCFPGEYHTRRFCMDFCEKLTGNRLKTTYESFCKEKPLSDFLPENFEAQLDIYRWLLKNFLISDDIFEKDKDFANRLENYIKITRACFDGTSKSPENSRCFLVFLEFLQVFFERFPNSGNLVLAGLYELLILAVLEPGRIGVYEYNHQSRQLFQREISGTFRVIQDKCGEEWKKPWIDFLRSELENSDLNSLDRVCGILILARTKWLGVRCPFPHPPKVLQHLALDNLCNNRVVLTRQQVRLSGKLLELSLELGLPLNILRSSLLNTSPGNKLSTYEVAKQALGRDLLHLLSLKLDTVESILPVFGNGDPQQWTVLSDVLQFLAEEQSLKLSKGFQVVRSFLDSWSSLERQAESYSQVGELAKCLEFATRIDRGQVANSSAVRHWISGSLSRTQLGVAKIRGFFKFLPLMVRLPHEEEETLIRNLQQFFANFFPVTISDWDNEMQKADYFACFSELCNVSAAPPNVGVFIVLADLVSRDEKHPQLNVFQESLVKLATDADLATQLRCLEKSYEICRNSRHYLASFRNIFNALLMNAYDQAVENTVIRNLKNLMDSLDSGPLSTSSSYMDKIANLEFLAIIFSRVDAETLHGRINQEFCKLRKIDVKSDGKDFARFALGAAFKLQRLGNPPTEAGLKQLQWKLQCAAYNAAISIVVNGQSNGELIGKLLFDRLNSTAWESLIGTSQYYALAVQLDRIPEQKQTLVNLRRKSNTMQSQDEVSFSSTQFGTQSSLSEDLQRFDFNHASLSSSQSLLGTSVSLEQRQADKLGYVVLESDELNNHDCMAPLVGLLQHMKNSGIFEEPKESGAEMPLWMKKLHEIFKLPNIHRNVVLFILRLIQNAQELFRPFAKSWINEILNALLYRVGGEPLNGFFRDVLAMILTWTIESDLELTSPEELELCGKIAEKIIQNIQHERRDVTLSNVEMLKTIFSVWAPLGLRIPESTVEEKLKGCDPMTGLQVVKLAVGQEVPGDWTRLCGDLPNILTRENQRRTARLCAEVCGMILSRGKLEPAPKEEFESQIRSILKRWHSTGKKDMFVDILHAMGSQYRPITETLAKLNWSSYNTVYGALKTKCLEILSWSWRGLDDPWLDVGREVIREILVSRNPSDTLAVLALLKDLIYRSSIDQWKPLWHELKELGRHENVDCRSLASELYCIAFDLTKGGDLEIKESVVGACLDAEETLRVRMLDFVASRLPDRTPDKITELVKEFYFPAYEKEFLVLCSYLLLRSVAANVDYKTPIFDRPLADIPFEVMELRTQPRFAQTVNWTQSKTGPLSTTGTFQAGQLRRTQAGSLAFSATQGATQSLNWLMTETADDSTPTAQPARSFREGPYFGSTRLSGANISTFDGSPASLTALSTMSWQRKFTKAPDKQTSYKKPMAYSGTKGIKEVPLYRRYRKGDLPDVQIPRSSLIAPIQAVAQKDPIVARLLFTSLVTAVRQEVKQTYGSSGDFCPDFARYSANIFATSKAQNPACLEALLELLWNQSDEHVAHEALDVIAEVSQKISSQQLGILIIENGLDSDPNPGTGKKSKVAKRSSSLSANHVTMGWFKVASLYSDLGDVDSTRAVLSDVIETSDLTKKALHYEAQKKWERAGMLYSEALNEELPEIEEDLCRSFQFKCMAELARWETMPSLGAENKWAIHALVCQTLDKVSSNPSSVLSSISGDIPADLLVYSDLAVLNVLDDNLDKARDWIDKSRRLFSQRYSATTDLSFAVKRKLIEELVALTEVHSYIQSDPESLWRKWTRSLPGQTGNLIIWDGIFRYRSSISNHFNLESDDYMAKLRLDLAQSALEQNHPNLALKLTHGYPQHEMQLPALIQARANILRCDLLEDPEKKLEAIIDGKRIADEALKNPLGLDLRFQFEEFQAYLCSQLIPFVDRPSDAAALPPASSIESARSLWNLHGREDVTALARLGLEHLKSSTQLMKGSNLSCTADAYVRLANYCNKWQENIGAGSSEEITYAILQSVKLGSTAGAALFPLVLREIKKSSKSEEIFKQHIRSVPFVAYRKWTNQIMSHLTQLPSAIGPLLVELSRNFAQFLQIPFNVTRCSMTARELALPEVKKLSVLLKQDSIWENLIGSIEYLLQPEIAAGNFLVAALENPSSAGEEYKKFRPKYLDLTKSSNNSLYGAAHYKFSTEYKPKFDAVFKTHPVSKDKINQLRIVVDKSKRKAPVGKAVLRDYSPWLANFKARDFPTTNFPLDKNSTVSVYSVKEDLVILSSLRRPVRVTFIGNDAKEYPVLVKHNEDLRQDERIQQLFHVMNDEFQRDADCQDRQLKVRTYEVIPLNPKVGLVQWLTNTVTLKDFVSSRADVAAAMNKALEHMRNQYGRDGHYYVKSGQDQIVKDFDVCRELVPSSALRNSLRDMTQSPEAFFFIRRQVASSHAVLCIAHWILGIGDRHLSNFLISTKTGELVGIDFGAAFGLATYLLPVPELVPIRLSPQFQHLITGLLLNGPIKETMIVALRALSSNPDALEAAMSIFVTEPTIDWIENSKKTARKQTEGTTHHSSSATGFKPWTPDEALSRTKSKLRGVHPAEVTCLDLRSNLALGSNSKYISTMMEVIRGTENKDRGKSKRSHGTQAMRARYPAAGLSVENQVDCLLDQATDPSLLGRMYFGWEPWV